MNYQLILANHPAQARFAGKPLFDDDGAPIPLFPDQRSIRLDGRVIALVSQSRLSFIVEGIPEAIKSQAEQMANEWRGCPLHVSEVQPLQEKENE